MARSTRLVILIKNEETLPSACYILSDESSIHCIYLMVDEDYQMVSSYDIKMCTLLN